MPSRIKGKTGVICLQLIHNRKIKLLRTRFRLFPAEWDERKEKVIFDSPPTSRQSYLQFVEAGLEFEIKRLHTLISTLELNNGEYTVNLIADLYISDSFNGYFFSFIDYVVRDLKEKGRSKTATILLTAKSSFGRFLQEYEYNDILIDKIDNDLMRKYEQHLKASGIMKNSISCYMRSLRSAYNQAVSRGLSIQRNPFANVFTRIDKTVKRAVDEDVIVRLKNMDLSSYKDLSLARDLFMFSFYMRGISFIDMANLKKNNVKGDYIIYFRSKTHQMLRVKIETCMWEIINRYGSQLIDNYLLPVYTFNNRSHTSLLRNYNKRLKRISNILALGKPLSSYVARHTWATFALRKGVPIEVISEGMGHENETTTRIYLASLGQSAVDKANAKVIKLR